MPGRYLKIAATILLTGAGSLFASDVLAQDTDRGIHLGSLLLTPAIREASIGYDSNVFNSSVNPLEDYTATFSPTVQISQSAGRSRLTVDTGVNFVYFRKYVSERSTGTSNALRWEFAAHRLRPYAAFSYSDVTNRPSPEINERVRNKTSGGSFGAQIRLSPRASLVFEAQHNRTKYDDTARYLGNDLSQELDQTSDTVNGSMWYELTPLTKLTVTADAQRQRYDTSGPRDARTYGLSVGVELAPTALIRGGATFGYRHLNVQDATVPDNRGFVLSVDLTYVLRDSTRLAVTAERDTAPSLADLQPYYIMTGATAGITQQVTRVMEVYVRANRQRQNYQYSQRSATASLEPLSNAVQDTAQGGLGWRIGRTAYMTVYVDASRQRGSFYGDARTTRIITSLSYSP